MAGQPIPKNPLTYSVLISHRGQPLGSGFYLADATNCYFVTARHVIYGQGAPRPANPQAPSVTLTSHTLAAGEVQTVLDVDLKKLEANGLLRSHPTNDVLVARVMTVGSEAASLGPVEGVAVQSFAPESITNISIAGVKRFADVQAMTEIITIGYPKLGIDARLQTGATEPQLDASQPLVRTGIVAGKYAKRKTLILDAKIYPGNSGGVVFEIDRSQAEPRYYAIGVASEFIPAVTEHTVNGKRAFQLQNSGYSGAESMDTVIEAIEAIAGGRPAV